MNLRLTSKNPMTIVWLLLFLCLSLTLRIWILAKNYSEQNIQTIFSLYTRQVQTLFSERFKGYEQLLRGLGGLEDEYHDIHQATWDNYLHNTKTLDTFPELWFLGFAKQMENGQTPIKFISAKSPLDKPLIDSNLLNLFQTPLPPLNINRQEMLISPYEKWASNNNNGGFLLVLPIYPKKEGSHSPPNFVFAWVLGNQFFNDITRTEMVDVGLRISEFSDDKPERTHVVYSDNFPTEYNSLSSRSLITVSHKTWTLEFKALPELENQSTVINAFIWVTGILFSFAIFGINKSIVDYNRIISLEKTHHELLANESKLRYEASHDILTGLPNRYGLENRFLQAIRYADEDARQVAIAFIDLDDFKYINDNFGHEYGDESMKILANRIESCVRNIDTVARIGGDEFLVLLSNQKGHAEINHLIHRILDQVRQPLNFTKESLQVSCSAGISLYPLDGDNLDDLLNKADKAMYLAKNKGKNQFLYYSEIPKTF